MRSQLFLFAALVAACEQPEATAEARPAVAQAAADPAQLAAVDGLKITIKYCIP
ncbi:MAG: hypothetical protein JKY37_24740 [Nannocystaceae bacterium]|nr:hypothetical protein [Nannocystaceae bacterium]